MRVCHRRLPARGIANEEADQAKADALRGAEECLQFTEVRLDELGANPDQDCRPDNHRTIPHVSIAGYAIQGTTTANHPPDNATQHSRPEDRLELEQVAFVVAKVEVLQREDRLKPRLVRRCQFGDRRRA